MNQFTPTKPNADEIRAQIIKLRELIDSEATNPLEARLAQVAEDALRWATEKTTWADPVDEIAGMAVIVVNDQKVRNIIAG